MWSRNEIDVTRGNLKHTVGLKSRNRTESRTRFSDLMVPDMDIIVFNP